jgi:aconitate hydratase
MDYLHQIKQIMKTSSGDVTYFSLTELTKYHPQIKNFTYSLKILVENILRNLLFEKTNKLELENILSWGDKSSFKKEIPFLPSRVVLQDFTGVPVVVDLASMREAAKEAGYDPSLINPIVRSELVIDHSVQVDYFASKGALAKNSTLEFKRNKERYQLLKWGQSAFSNFSIIPPGVGIVHQVNLEYLSPGIMIQESKNQKYIFPDTCLGTDSHTTMINGLGVLGWGVGGIEAEAVMLGQPYYMKLPEIIGVRLIGSLKEGTTATDLVLTVTEILRKHGVVEKFVEFFGPGLVGLSLADRATIANMAPEYGATCGYFPIDEQTIEYLKNTGRENTKISEIEEYFRNQGIFYSDDIEPSYSDVIDINLNLVESSLAGPKRPQDKVKLSDVRDSFYNNFDTHKHDDLVFEDGSVVIAAITSCTNTSNPSVMVGAGLMARNLNRMGLKPKPWVKTSMAPGSKVVTKYLSNSKLDLELDKIGFSTVGYGCTTCIGNSGPLPHDVSELIEDNDLSVASVLSGNRNFEGRIHPQVKANYLASPMLVVAYAIVGTVDIDLENQPIGKDNNGKKIYLSDIWPSQKEINMTIQNSIKPDMYNNTYSIALKGNDDWNNLDSSRGKLFKWDKESSYIQKAPFFDDFSLEMPQWIPIKEARILVELGDTVTTDHISPAGSIPESAPSGQHLISRDIPRSQFNSYGSRRGNHNVMIRGTFGNIRLKNLMTPDREGDWTIHYPDKKVMRIFEASELYVQEKIPLIVIAGNEYGTGSSRDWAAKGPSLLGVRVVIANGFERIHRSNLIGMGVIPLEFHKNENLENLGIEKSYKFNFNFSISDIKPRQKIKVEAISDDGEKIEFETLLRIDTPIEIEYLKNGGVLQYLLRQMLKK